MPTLDEFILLHKLLQAAVARDPGMLGLLRGATRSFGWNVLGGEYTKCAKCSLHGSHASAQIIGANKQGCCAAGGNMLFPTQATWWTWGRWRLRPQRRRCCGWRTTWTPPTSSSGSSSMASSGQCAAFATDLSGC